MLGGFAYFIEYASGTSDATHKPATASPPAAWTACSLGTILSIEYGDERADSAFMRPLPMGGYEKVNRSIVTQDFVILQTREMGDLVWRLQMGLAATIAEGTAQTPGLLQDRKVEGWLRLQGRALSGYDRFLQDWWCECRLEGKNKFEDKVVTPSLRFTLIKAVAGAAVAGNSCNFPAQA